MKRSILTAAFFSCAMVATLSARDGGRIMVDNDEWTLSDAGFAREGSSNGIAYARDCARYLTGAPYGARVWINSSNFGLTGVNLSSALSIYTLTDTGTFTPFNLADLELYDAVFLGGNSLTFAEEEALILYVRGGGGVYIAAGTGNITGGAAGEAAQWNAVLHEFSLNMAQVQNNVDGTIPTDSVSPVLRGVSQLYYDNGNSINVIGANAQILTSVNGQGLIGVFSEPFTDVP